MSDDTIKRSDAINLCEKWRNRTNEHHDKNGWYIADTLLKTIKELPSADRPQGEWKHLKGDEWLCSNCGYVVWTEGSWEHPLERGKDYCEHCGARMKGADDE